ncbi:MAG TPA: hypothetical protein DCE80_18810 [Ignavibacteriales bacterium]|nr:hypothetical protein [Ignavibacteriales bacterium]
MDDRKMKPKTVDSMLKGIIDCLDKKEKMTPAALGKELNIHPKTAGRYVEAAEKLNMITCEPIKFGKNTVKLCKINSNYREFIKKTKEMK